MPTTFLTKTALTISGSDSSGGAGIQGDLKTFTALGVYGMSAVTAVAACNTLGVKQMLQLEAELVSRQIDTVAGDIEVDAVKTGMLGTAAVVEAVEDSVRRNSLAPYVCDPAFFTGHGEKLLEEEAIPVMVKRLFPLASVVTPNLREAATLADVDAPPGGWTIPLAKDSARRIVGKGAKAVVIKGLEQGDQTVDLYFDGKEFLEFAAKTQPKEKTHGSGAAFSAAITAGLANRLNLVDAIDQAKQLVNMAIQYSDGQGRGIAPINVLSFAPKKK